MKNLFYGVLCAGAIAMSAAFSVNAATIDFSGVQGSQASPLVLPEATITNLTGTTVLVGAGAAGALDGFCFIVGGTCDADGQIDFSSAVSNLSFDIDGWNPGDFVEINAFSGATLLGSLNVTASGNLDFSGFGSITRLTFDDSSSTFGVGYSTFLFDGTTTQVSGPGMLALFGLGILGLGFARRRKQTT